MSLSRTPIVRLRHIRDEIEAIRRAFATRTLTDLDQDYLLFRATERALLIISEAVKTVPKELTDRHPDIDWRLIRGLGNILRHEYETVEAPILWQIVQQELPDLGTAVEAMIADLEAGSG